MDISLEIFNTSQYISSIKELLKRKFIGHKNAFVIYVRLITIS